MKNIFAMIVLASLLASCTGTSTEAEVNVVDSTAVDSTVVDTTVLEAAPAVDSAAAVAE
jgi:PBP1b-binding outer membrane lipoprotein LpoB